MANRLIDSTSPYLLQHAHNPVAWYPWGAEALERAKREDKPIFLSIGYAACHWCHVMEHGVFENAEIAALMNEHFVNIKVDREERPDLDELYMLATQLMTGQGGWPMSVWLTPELRPFYAGTYFPPEDGLGRPGFPRLEMALVEAWKNRRGDLEEQARKVVEAIRLHADETGEVKSQEFKREKLGEWLRVATEQLADRFDEVNGGLGGAPKFPPHQVLGLWVAQFQVAPELSGLSAGEQRVLAGKVVRTLDGMARGGIYDHVGGGFSRYSTDERWLVPHFEKMLYDNAQLAPVYAAAGGPEYERIARETLDFFLREMRSEGGAFYSSLDADSEGAEGKYYVWTLADVRAALADEEDARLVIEHFGMTERGNWHESPVEGGNVLAVAKTAEVLAEEQQVAPEVMRRRLDGLLSQMRTVRQGRTRPGLDDKILTSWNGLMLSALAFTGRRLRESRYVDAARRLADFLCERHMQTAADGLRLLRVSRGGGAAHTDGFLDDHAYLLNGLLDLLEATPAGPDHEATLQRAQQLAEMLLRQFEDPRHGGFFYTGPRHEQLFARMKNAADGATPSANGVAIRALLRLARVLAYRRRTEGIHTNAADEMRYREAAYRAIGAFEKHISRRPEYFPTILLALLEENPVGRVAEGISGPREGGADSAPGKVEVQVEPVGPVGLGRPFEVRVRLSVAPGFHIQAHKSGDGVAIRIRVLKEGVTLSQEWSYPAAEPVDGGVGYAGVVTLTARCVLSGQVSAGEVTCRVVLLTQVCSGDACLAPEQVACDFRVAVHG